MAQPGHCDPIISEFLMESPVDLKTQNYFLNADAPNPALMLARGMVIIG